MRFFIYILASSLKLFVFLCFGLAPLAHGRELLDDPWIQAVRSSKDSALKKHIAKYVKKYGPEILSHAPFRKAVNKKFFAGRDISASRPVRPIRPPPGGPPPGFRPSPFFVLGMASTGLSFSGEKSNQPGSSGATGSAGAGSSTGAPNSLNVGLMALYRPSRADSFGFMYMHMFQLEEPETPSAGAIPGGQAINFDPPSDIVALNYSRQFSKGWSGVLTSSYLNSTGFQDPTAGLNYRSRYKDDDFGPIQWSWGSTLSAPLSDQSKEQTKITTFATNVNIGQKAGAWSNTLTFGYSYTFYETTENLAATVGGQSGVTPGAPGAFPGQGGAPPSGALPPTGFENLDINYLSREVARTSAGFNTKYAFNRNWNANSGINISYNYLESTYSRWNNNITLVSIGYTAMGFSVSAGATLTSDNSMSDQFTFPDQLGARINLSYSLPLLGGPPKGSAGGMATMLGAGGSDSNNMSGGMPGM